MTALIKYYYILILHKEASLLVRMNRHEKNDFLSKLLSLYTLLMWLMSHIPM